MAANDKYPSKDGVACSWADIQVSVSATGAELLTLEDIKAINTGSSVEVGEQRAGGRVMKRTTGARSDEASLTLYASGFQKLLRNLKTAAESLGYTRGAQVVISPVKFDLQFQYSLIGDEEIYECRIKGARYMGRTRNDSEGTDPSEVEVTLSVLEVVDVVDGTEVIAL
jgi:hypothetical protein